jgi:hypothetical protein
VLAVVTISHHLRKEVAMPVLNLIGKETDTREHPKGSNQLGTMAEFTGELRDKASNALVGSYNAVCIGVRKPDMWLCHDTWDLQKAAPLTGGLKGDLVSGGLLDFADNKFTVAIFGGTDDFRKAQGQIHGDSTNYPQVTDFKAETLP